MPDSVEKELGQARDALSDAKILRQHSGTNNAIVNRLYYACFHAAQAVLYARGIEPTSHQGVVSLFGEEVVLAGDATRDDGQFLNELRDYRQRADYKDGAIAAAVDDLVERTETFVTDMAELV